MATKVGNKTTRSICLNVDAEKLLLEQAKEAGVTASTYVERLILEAHYREKYEKK